MLFLPKKRKIELRIKAFREHCIATKKKEKRKELLPKKRKEEA